MLTHPLPLRHQGTWAELLVAAAALVARKPAAVPWETAAAFPVPALTADQALSEATRSPAGECVLVHGAGVTGGLVVQLAVARGAMVVATAGPSSESHVRDYGARFVLDYHDPDWPARVREAVRGGRGVAPSSTPRGKGSLESRSNLVPDLSLYASQRDPPSEALMTEDSKNLMSAYFDAWRARDANAMRALLADDATFAGRLEFGFLR